MLGGGPAWATSCVQSSTESRARSARVLNVALLEAPEQRLHERHVVLDERAELERALDRRRLGSREAMLARCERAPEVAHRLRVLGKRLRELVVLVLGQAGEVQQLAQRCLADEVGLLEQIGRAVGLQRGDDDGIDFSSSGSMRPGDRRSAASASGCRARGRRSARRSAARAHRSAESRRWRRAAGSGARPGCAGAGRRRRRRSGCRSSPTGEPRSLRARSPLRSADLLRDERDVLVLVGLDDLGEREALELEFDRAPQHAELGRIARRLLQVDLEIRLRLDQVRLERLRQALRCRLDGDEYLARSGLRPPRIDFVRSLLRGPQLRRAARVRVGADAIA